MEDRTTLDDANRKRELHELGLLPNNTHVFRKTLQNNKKLTDFDKILQEMDIYRLKMIRKKKYSGWYRQERQNYIKLCWNFDSSN